MSRRLRSFGAFWYDFVIADDWRGGVAAGGSPPLPARSTVVPAGQSESRQRRTAKLPRFVLADHHQRPLANVTPWYSWELMMKPVRIVILATVAFLASA